MNQKTYEKASKLFSEKKIYTKIATQLDYGVRTNSMGHPQHEVYINDIELPFDVELISAINGLIKKRIAELEAEVEAL